MAEKEIILQGEDGQVDELVLTTQDQASCNSLEDCVRMLFPQEGEKKPRLRFKGFEGDWERFSFGDLYEHCVVKNDMTFGKDKIISVANMYFLQDVNNSDDDYLRTYNVFRLGDIAFEGHSSKEFAHGRFVENTIGDGIVSHIFDVFRPKSEKYDLMFWKYAINNEMLMGKILSRCTKASTMMNDIVADEFLKESFLVPSYEEQKKIGEFLSRLDTQIEFYQHQFDELKHLKSACLNEMFPQQNESVPSVRFSGFEGDWEIVSFKDITRLAGVRNRENLPLESYSISNENGFVPQNEQFENGGTMSKADKRLYYIVSPDSFAYNPARINVGSIGYDDLDKDVIVSSLYVVFKTDEKTYNPFLNYWFKTPTFRKLIEQYQEGGVRLYFFYDKLCKCSFRRPSFDEQRQIATFFSELDKQISAQQEQLERLKQMKQSCLGLLFADNQSITPPPHLRFKGFNGEWIMIRFSDIATIRRGLTYSPENICDRGVRVLRSSNIDEDAFTISDSDVFVDSRCVNIPLANNGDILVTAANGSPRLVGKHCLVESDDEKMVPGGFMYLVSSDEAEFLNACMGASWYKKFLVTGVSGGNGAIGNLSKDELEKCEFYIPKEKEERNRIASFFTNLDKQISLQSQQVEKLMQLKKACLNQFIA